MKKLLISIVIILVLILSCLTMFKGLHIGNLSIFGFKEIKDESQKLDLKLKEATSLASVQYLEKLEDLDEELKDMKSEKQKYEDMIATASESEVKTVVEEQIYTIDKLWTKIGSLATDEGLSATFDLSATSRNPIVQSGVDSDYKYYDIKFSLEGGYANISLYISDIENDSQLGVRIEDFKMEPVGDGTTVKATFVCKDIAIRGISVVTPSNDETDGNTTNTTGNTTDNTIIENTTIGNPSIDSPQTTSTQTTSNSSNTGSTSNIQKNIPTVDAIANLANTVTR